MFIYRVDERVISDFVAQGVRNLTNLSKFQIFPRNFISHQMGLIHNLMHPS